MINLRPLILAIGAMLCFLSIVMLIPAVVGYFSDGRDYMPFIFSAVFTSFCGGIMVLTNRLEKNHNISIKQAFLLTTMIWTSLVLFSSLPFLFSELKVTFIDSFFESMSALTTTGATVFSGLDSMPRSILVWRSLLQWLGGIGIIVMAMAVLPLLKVGGMQLFRTESSDKSDKVLPKINQICSAIGGVYLVLTIICALLLWNAGMTVFDAINHGMTTIATAGFSTHDASISFFNSREIEIIMVIFMIISGIPFALYIQMLRGRSMKLWQDSQVRWFLFILLASVLITTLWLTYEHKIPTSDAFRDALFNVVSITTTTGFSSTDYNGWGTFTIVFLFLLGVMGGCTGSTTGGIKIFRYQVLFATTTAQINRLIHPHGIFKPMYNKNPVTDEAANSVLSFVVLFATCFSILAMFLSLTGLDFITSMSGSVAALANLGPGLGDIIGPNGNYETLPDASKWLLTIGMLVGRLEIFTVLILFSPHFWKD